MSASLVGSEMCIRDRTATSSGWVWGQMSNADQRAWRPSGCSDPCSMEPCLLYTSDAADDM
eukprot:11131973-Alexandrium_andersonii.AAC.1